MGFLFAALTSSLMAQHRAPRQVVERPARMSLDARGEFIVSRGVEVSADERAFIDARLKKIDLQLEAAKCIRQCACSGCLVCPSCRCP